MSSTVASLVVFVIVVGLVIGVGIAVGMIAAGAIDRITAPRRALPGSTEPAAEPEPEPGAEPGAKPKPGADRARIEELDE